MTSRLKEVMARFGKVQIAQAIPPDAEWHFAFGAELPHGWVRRGLEGFVEGVADNDNLFERLRFGDVVIRGLGDDQTVMTYLAAGQ